MALPKFNLRDLFWLVIVVAMGLGWWQDRKLTHARFDKERQHAARKVDFLVKSLDENGMVFKDLPPGFLLMPNSRHLPTRDVNPTVPVTNNDP